MQTTANLGLKKPEGTDVVNIQDFNDNSDLLDNHAATMATLIGTKAPLASPALTGNPTAPTAAVDTSTTQVASTAFVLGQAGMTAPLMSGTAGVGTSKRYARADHVHPIDTSRAAQIDFVAHLAEIATEERHGMRVNQDGELEFHDGVEWKKSSWTYVEPPILYELGDEKTEVTGGWVAGYSTLTGSQSKESDHLLLAPSGSVDGTTIPERTYVTNNKVNLSTVNTVKVLCQIRRTDEIVQSTTAVVVSSDKMSRYAVYDAYISDSAVRSTSFQELLLSVDVSNLEGSYYIRVHQLDNGTAVGSPQLKILKVWGEV